MMFLRKKNFYCVVYFIVFSFFLFPQVTRSRGATPTSTENSTQSLLDEEQKRKKNKLFLTSTTVDPLKTYQEIPVQNPKVLDPSQGVLFALNSSHRVTSGDTFTIILGTLDALEPLTVVASVNTKGALDLSTGDSINLKARDYPNALEYIRKRVTSYTGIVPTVALSTLSFFPIEIKGEAVMNTSDAYVTSITRLGTLVDKYRTHYTSIRSVGVKRINRKVKQYDLFLALRGDTSQNPVLQPGDQVILEKNTKGSIVLSGEVQRPGTYELLGNETVEDIVENFGGGYTQFARKDNISIARSATDAFDYEAYTYNANSKEAKQGLYPLKPYDFVVVSSRETRQSSILLQGALVDETTSSSVAKRIQLFQSETVGAFLNRNLNLMSENADFENLSLISGKDILPINLSSFLKGEDTNLDSILLKSGDVINVPFMEVSVQVNGAVKSEGNYPWFPNQTAEYFLLLAGGFDSLRHGGNAVKIYNSEGVIKNKNDIIEPGDVIYAPTNSFFYYAERYTLIVGFILITLDILDRTQEVVVQATSGTILD